VSERTIELSDALSQQQLLTAELSHRVKNSIASVQSLVDQTLRRASSPSEARATVSGRLTALARAHDQLAAGKWVGASLRDIVKAAAATFGTKVHIDISDEILTARAALDLSLVFHELMTNAVKYGALQSEQGSISIRSLRSTTGEAFTIIWTERGGPTVQVPTRKGFGTRLARDLLTHDLRGECEFSFEPQGLKCTMRVPVKDLIARGHVCIHGCAH
jgi:two-component sensor histidine kinase